MPRTGNDSLDIREIYESLQWILPAINPNIGQIEPPARYKRTGLIAYADGSTWNPNSQGAGYYRYDGAAWVKLLEPDDTFTTSIDANKLGGKTLATVEAEIALTKYFESTEQTITAAGSLTLAHGLGVEPKLFQVMLICKTADGGYSVNDKVIVAATHQYVSCGVSLVPDSTNLNVRFGAAANTFKVVHKTTGNEFLITNANWKAIFRTWA